MKSVKFSRTSEDNKTKVSISSKLLIWRLWVKIFNARNGSDILSCISNAPDSLAKAQVHPYCFGRMYFFCFETVRVNEEKCQRLLQGKKNNYCFLNWAREYCEEEIGGGHSLYSLDCAQSSIFPCDCFERYSWARAVAILISRGKKLLRSVTFGWRVWISSTTPPPQPPSTSPPIPVLTNDLQSPPGSLSKQDGSPYSQTRRLNSTIARKIKKPFLIVDFGIFKNCAQHAKRFCLTWASFSFDWLPWNATTIES